MSLQKWISRSDMKLSVLKPGLVLSALLLLALVHTSSSSSLAETFTPAISYYFNDFTPGQAPWKPGQPLNIEEVFKNYQYYEIMFDTDGKGITVIRYLKGNKESSEKYLILPDGSLQKK